MDNSYFKRLPDFDYVSRVNSTDQINSYVTVKNLFKRAKIRDDIFSKLNYFVKYKIIGDERPEIVALNFYGDQSYDWLVLLSNNILNIQSEWPLSQTEFEEYLLSKYGSYEEINRIRYYESVECRDLNGAVIFPAGIKVDRNYSITYYDDNLGSERIISDMTTEVTNYDYEVSLEEKKRNIFVLKPEYLSVILSDMDSVMQYKKGSTQYVSRTLKRGDNIKLYGS